MSCIVNPEKSLYIADKIIEQIPKAKRLGNKLNFRCPLCGDGKKSTSHRGWFYIDTCSYYCWNEGCIANEHGISGVRFLSLLTGQDISAIKYDIFKNAYGNDLSKSMNDKDESKTEEEIFEALLEVNHSKPIESAIEEKLNDGVWTSKFPEKANAYIKKRHIFEAPYIPSGFKLYYNESTDRIVIPWSDGFYQERTYLYTQRKDVKYLFPKDVQKPIFGLDSIDPSYKKIFIMEGVFDSIWVKNAVATGGIKMSEHQLEKLKEYIDGGYEIIFFPDNQHADKSACDKCIKMIEDNPQMKMFIWPDKLKRFKDINESICASTKFIDLWKSIDFIEANIFSGIQARFKLNAI